MREIYNDSLSDDQKFYDNEPLSSADNHKYWMKEIEKYFEVYSGYLNETLLKTSGNVAELGAGSCGLSLCVSRLKNVRSVTALDISMARMQKMIGFSRNVLSGNEEKIKTVSADFNAPLPFQDGELDAVLFDASLHHSKSMWNILSECNRILANGGILIAQRESYLNAFRANKQLNNLLETPEAAAKVT